MVVVVVVCLCCCTCASLSPGRRGSLPRICPAAVRAALFVEECNVTEWWSCRSQVETGPASESSSWIVGAVSMGLAAPAVALVVAATVKAAVSSSTVGFAAAVAVSVAAAAAPPVAASVVVACGGTAVALGGAAAAVTVPTGVCPVLESSSCWLVSCPSR